MSRGRRRGIAKADLKFLLLQARDPGDPMAAHEHACFAKALGVPAAAIRCHDLLAGVPDEGALSLCDLLLVGGSGDYSVLNGHAWVRGFIDFLSRVVVGERFPTFASCFGFQGLVLAGGGAIVKDEPHGEVGTYDVFVTDAGAADPLLGALAPSFKAQLGHTDRADRLPAGVIHLAHSALSPYQAFRVAGTPVIATQFHPELDREANTLRYMRYLANYRAKGISSDADDPVLRRLAESPQATALLPRWVDDVLTHGEWVGTQAQRR
jgi:GMP synthase (glutamine-hydrolysing)